MNTLKFNQIEFNHIGEQTNSSIKLQEKSITITKNGTTEVMPNSGYALERVKVKVDTPKRDIRYYDAIRILKENSMAILLIGVCSSSIYIDRDNLDEYVIRPGFPNNINIKDLIAVAIDYDMKIKKNGTSPIPITIREYYNKYPEVLKIINKYEITEEEYYNLYK